MPRPRRLPAILALVFAVLVAAGAGLYLNKDRLKRNETFRSLYLRYRNWRHDLPTAASMGDGGAATKLVLVDPVGIAGDDRGNVYVGDRRGRFIWRLDPGGGARVVAGAGGSWSLETGLPASLVDLSQPEGLCFDSSGNLLFADKGHNAVLRIDSEGTLTRFAGNGESGHGGDGGPATDARLNGPYAVAVDREGRVYIADYGNHRIRMVDTMGRIHTVAGTGEPGYAGDGGPATAARLQGPYGVGVDAESRLLIADSGNHVVRRVENDGTITTIAGTGERGYSGDGGPARAARLDSPQGIAMDHAGRLLIGDEHNHCIRRVARDGTIETLVGKGMPGCDDDPVPAAAARFSDPEHLLPRADGGLLITDGDNGRVRLLTADGEVRTIAGSTRPPPR